jgi:hypothetical protein
MTKDRYDTVKEIHGAFSVLLLSFCFVWIVNNSIYEQIPNIQLAPAVIEKIKSVDPLDFLREGDGVSDYVNFK